MKIYIDLKRIRGTIKGEARDCGVTSLSIAGGVSYREAWELLFNWGRGKGEGVSPFQLEMASKGLNRASKRFSAMSKVTLAQFIKTHYKGRFIVYTRNHAMAVVDGRLYDCNMTRGQTKIEGFITL